LTYFHKLPVHKVSEVIDVRRKRIARKELTLMFRWAFVGPTDDSLKRRSLLGLVVTRDAKIYEEIARRALRAPSPNSRAAEVPSFVDSDGMEAFGKELAGIHHNVRTRAVPVCVRESRVKLAET
jgi:hypothetical protein